MSMTKIEELEQKLNECQKALAELKESKKEGEWKPQISDYYWFRTSCGDVSGDDWTNDKYDDWRINNIPIFPTKEACERYWHFMDTVKEKSYEFTELEWKNDEIKKYTIYYNFLNDEFCTTCISDSKFLGEIYFRTKEEAQYIINNFKEELMEWFL